MVLRAGSVTAKGLEGQELFVELTRATEVQGWSKADARRWQELCNSQHSSAHVENQCSKHSGKPDLDRHDI